MRDTIEINGETYTKVHDNGDMKIVCVDNRGLTFVGRVEDVGDGWTRIHKARCIIRWGTTQHIAEIVPGPTDNTKLGAESTVDVRTDNIQFSYACGEGWENHD